MECETRAPNFARAAATASPEACLFKQTTACSCESASSCLCSTSSSSLAQFPAARVLRANTMTGSERQVEPRGCLVSVTRSLAESYRACACACGICGGGVFRAPAGATLLIFRCSALRWTARARQPETKRACARAASSIKRHSLASCRPSLLRALDAPLCALDAVNFIKRRAR